MTPAQLRSRRMHGLRLWGPPAADPVTLLRELGALQAQEFGPALWSVGQRSGADDETVRRAFADGYILRTHLLRPTWHFVAATELHWILAATADRVHARNAIYYERLGVERETVRRAKTITRSALRGGAHLTRAQLSEQWKRGGLEAEGQHLATILMHLELDGVICSGAPAGKQQTYALVSERVPQTPSITRGDALARLAQHYFVTRGPATVHDFATWASLPIGVARSAHDAVRDGLEEATVDGLSLWHAPGPQPPPTRSPRFDLVQTYDEIGMSFSKSRVFLGSSASLTTRPRLPHAILRNGQLIGHWKYALRSDDVAIETELPEVSGADERALAHAARQFGAHFGLRATVSA